MTVKLLSGVCVHCCDKHCNGTEKIRNSKFCLINQGWTHSCDKHCNGTVNWILQICAWSNCVLSEKWGVGNCRFEPTPHHIKCHTCVYHLSCNYQTPCFLFLVAVSYEWLSSHDRLLWIFFCEIFTLSSLNIHNWWLFIIEEEIFALEHYIFMLKT